MVSGRIRLCASLSLLATLGCGAALGPEASRTTRVSGRVHLGGQPLTGGWIEFFPIDGATGLMRSAPIRKDGTFEADRVPVGKNMVGLVGVPGRVARAVRKYETLGTPITRVIPPGGISGLDIDLVEEILHEMKKTAEQVP